MFTRKIYRDNRGQSLVEMALVLPLLIIILFGIIEFGRVFHSYLIITHASREGARVGVVGQSNTDIKQQIQDAAPLNLDKLTITITPSEQQARTPGVPLTVSVGYQVDLFTPILGSILPNPVLLQARTTMRME
ncbi:MAG: TadE/TadG family type IV pilus assembly protein [Bacillota bacterium]